MDPRENACHGIFLVFCPACQVEATISVTFADKITKMERKVVSKKSQTVNKGPHISINEVLDMHNFLKKDEVNLKDIL